VLATQQQVALGPRDTALTIFARGEAADQCFGQRLLEPTRGPGKLGPFRLRGIEESGSHMTPRWRGVDSNFQYAEAVKLRSRSGTPKIYIKAAESGNERAHSFCPECGTPIYEAASGPTRRSRGLAVVGLRCEWASA
jgi:Glutathione-dependent formaldehyde-activating enzyme